MPAAAAPYDALLLVSFGGPEKPEDVVPFLRNVTAGRDIPDERLAEVGAHYALFGGRSPINDQNRTLLAAIGEDLRGSGIDIPVYWGNRNWDPYLAAAVAKVPGAPRLDRLRSYFNHPGFIEPNVDATLAALALLPEAVRREAHLVFVTHSIPEAMASTAGPLGGAYVAQHRSVMDEIGDRVREETGHRHPAALVYCSRSGPPSVPWLEPDVNVHLEALAAQGVRATVLVPIGFVSDHMEVVYDLDTEALATARRLGLACERAATAGVDPRFVAMVRDLLLERAAVERGEEPERLALGGIPAAWDVCAAGCCVNLRGPRPALCGSDR